MANTTFVEIIDLATLSFKDYKLSELFAISETDFTTYLSGFVVKAITKFYECKQPIQNADLTTGTFPVVLTLAEKIILADLTVIEWMTTKILDVTQMNNFLNDTDFKMFSNANNLTAKINTQNILIERANQQMEIYGLKNTDWASWGMGNFV
jgi:hypothetical protein